MYKKSLLLLMFFGITTFAAQEKNKENKPLCEASWRPHWGEKWRVHTYIVKTYEQFMPQLTTLPCQLSMFTVENRSKKGTDQFLLQCQKCHYTINLFQKEKSSEQETTLTTPALIHLCKFAKLEETFAERLQEYAFTIECCGDYSHKDHKGCKKKYEIMFK